MGYLGNTPGLGGPPVAFRFLGLQGVVDTTGGVTGTKFSGLDVNNLIFSYTKGFLAIYLGGHRLSPDDFEATDGTTFKIKALLEPTAELFLVADSPWNPANTYTQAQMDAALQAQFQTVFRKRNRFLNPAMMVVQERGDLFSFTSALTGSQIYLCDGIYLYYTCAGTLTCSHQALLTPGGSNRRLRFVVATADAAVAAGDTCILTLPVEGNEVADLQWGTTAAKSVTVRVGFKTSVAGSYGFQIGNSGGSRTYLYELVVAPNQVNTDLLVTFTVPGDVAGTWLKNNALGLSLTISLMMGSNTQGTAGNWQSVNRYATANQVNFMAQVGNTCEVFDVGLYDGTTLPAFEVPGYADELRRCQRYYWKGQGSKVYSGVGNYVVAATTRFPVTQRIANVTQMTGGGTIQFLDVDEVTSYLGVSGWYDQGLVINDARL